MQNTFLQSQLEDICHFRNKILKSHQKIQHQLYRRTTPIKLASNCDCIQKKIVQDPYLQCSQEENTTNYFSEKAYFSMNDKHHQSRFQKNHFLQHYLKAYETNKLNIDPQPLKQRKDYLNFSHKDLATTSSKTKVKPEQSEISAFQKIELPFNENKRNRTKHERNFFSSTLNPQRISYDDIEVENKRGFQSINFFKPTTEIKHQIQPRKKMMVSQSQRKFINKCSKQTSFVQSSRNSSKSKIQNFNKTINDNLNKKINLKKVNFSKVNQSKKKLKNSSNQTLQQVYQRIKKRMYLSTAVNKSIDNNFLVLYQKELRERSEIVDKIMSHEKVLKKYKHTNYQNKLL